MFQTSIPVIADGFRNRKAELAKLADAIARLRAGAPRWIAIIGPRKVGKTSLILEAARRAASADLAVVTINAQEHAPPSSTFFRLYALRVLDGLLGRELGESLERAASSPTEYRRRLQDTPGFGDLPGSLRAEILEVADATIDPARVAAWLQLPQDIADCLGRRVLVAIDEFHELGALSSHGRAFDPFPLMRSSWQTHTRVGYAISGSARSLLLAMLTEKASPFFQHFAILELGPFDRQDALLLLKENSPQHCPISAELRTRAVDVLGGHPFYLQMIGEALTERGHVPDMDDLKSALQELVFSRVGRLGLYFENEYHRLVGHATSLSAMLHALAPGPARLTDIATGIKAASGAAVRYIERMGDAVRHRDDGLYELADPVFALWLQWRQPGGTVVPMTLVGDEAERTVASALAAMGFDLVYQSRASRGSFDLLAIRGGAQLGIQVKRCATPLRFSLKTWGRMEADARRLGWAWVVAAVAQTGEVTILDPARAHVGREVRLNATATIENLLLWVDRAQNTPR